VPENKGSKKRTPPANSRQMQESKKRKLMYLSTDEGEPEDEFVGVGAGASASAASGSESAPKRARLEVKNESKTTRSSRGGEEGGSGSESGTVAGFPVPAYVRCDFDLDTLDLFDMQVDPQVRADLDRVCVKESTIPHAGLGLFARKAIQGPRSSKYSERPGQVIANYSGKLVKESDLPPELLDERKRSRMTQEQLDPYRYLYKLKNGLYIDAAATLSMGRFANTCRPSDSECGENNARLGSKRDFKSAQLIATDDIDVGDEIFVDYGEDYLFQEETESGSESDEDDHQGNEGVEEEGIEAVSTPTPSQPTIKEQAERQLAGEITEADEDVL
jgi:hypothetical protein